MATGNKQFGVHMAFDNSVVDAQNGWDYIASAKAQIDDAAAIGTDIIRFPGDWRQFEWDGAGQHNEYYVQFAAEVVNYAASKGIETVMLFAQTPAWAAPAGASNPIWHPPENASDYGSAIAGFLQRMNAAGAGDHIVAWEIWNEPNVQEFWDSADLRANTFVLNDVASAAEYVDMLNAAYDALKAVDPNTVVLGGSLAGGDVEYVEKLYELGAKFDALAIHPYARVNDSTGLAWGPSETSNGYLDQIWSFQNGVEKVRQLMVDNGDADKDLWLTEFGWSSGDGWGDAGSEQLQAQYISEALDLIAGWDFVPAAIVYRLYEDAYKMGLLYADGTRKPVADAFETAASSLPDDDPETPPVRNTIVGTSENDTLKGSNDDDNIAAGAGNDLLIGRPGDDTLSGSTGVDTALFVGSANITANLRKIAGQETGQGIDVFLSIENLTADSGDDKLTGNDKANILSGRMGADVLNGLGGNDKLIGGGGNDQLWGGNGNDSIIGGSGADTLSGNSGNDLLNGGFGNDRLIGGFGSDTLRGDIGNDILTADAGNDLMFGGSGRDTLNGGLGRDTLKGDAGNDLLCGKAGNDRIIGGSGIDTAVYSGPVGRYNVIKTGNFIKVVDSNGEFGTDLLSSVEKIKIGGTIFDIDSLL